MAHNNSTKILEKYHEKSRNHPAKRKTLQKTTHPLLKSTNESRAAPYQSLSNEWTIPFYPIAFPSRNSTSHKSSDSIQGTFNTQKMQPKKTFQATHNPLPIIF